MNFLRHWKIAACLAAIFVAGAVSGSLVTLRVVKKSLGRNLNSEGWAAATLQAYRKKLKLTPEQIHKIQPEMDQAAQEIKGIGGNARLEIFSVVMRMNEQIATELTAEQQKLFEEMKQDFREKWKNRPAARPLRK